MAKRGGSVLFSSSQLLLLRGAQLQLRDELHEITLHQPQPLRRPPCSTNSRGAAPRRRGRLPRAARDPLRIHCDASTARSTAHPLPRAARDPLRIHCASTAPRCPRCPELRRIHCAARVRNAVRCTKRARGAHCIAAPVAIACTGRFPRIAWATNGPTSALFLTFRRELPRYLV